MSVLLSVQPGTGEEIPLWFTNSDSKRFRYHLIQVHWQDPDDDLMRLLEHFKLTLTPYDVIGEDPEPMDGFVARDPSEQRIEQWHKYHSEMEATLHPPQEFIAAYAPLLEALDSNPKVLSEIGIGPYFVEGVFRQDLVDLLAMFEWAVEHNIPLVRLADV